MARESCVIVFSPRVSASRMRRRTGLPRAVNASGFSPLSSATGVATVCSGEWATDLARRMAVHSTALVLRVRYAPSPSLDRPGRRPRSGVEGRRTLSEGASVSGFRQLRLDRTRRRLPLRMLPADREHQLAQVVAVGEGMAGQAGALAPEDGAHGQRGVARGRHLDPQGTEGGRGLVDPPRLLDAAEEDQAFLLPRP